MSRISGVLLLVCISLAVSVAAGCGGTKKPAASRSTPTPATTGGSSSEALYLGDLDEADTNRLRRDARKISDALSSERRVDAAFKSEVRKSAVLAPVVRRVLAGSATASEVATVRAAYPNAWHYDAVTGQPTKPSRKLLQDVADPLPRHSHHLRRKVAEAVRDIRAVLSHRRPKAELYDGREPSTVRGFVDDLITTLRIGNYDGLARELATLPQASH